MCKASELHFQKSKLNKRQADKEEIENEIEDITLQSYDDNNNS